MYEPEGPSLARLVWRHLRARLESRPYSFYLLIAILIMVVLSVGLVFVRDNPHKFAAFLIADFLFFFAVLMGAIADAFGILRKHLHEKRRVLPETLNEAKFLSELRQRVKKKEED